MAEVANRKQLGKSVRLVCLLVVGALLFTIGVSVGGSESRDVTNKLTAQIASEAQKNKQFKLDFVAQAKRLNELRDKIKSLSDDNCYLTSSVAHQRKLIASHVKINKSRMSSAIKRNVGSAAAGLFPGFGDAADLAATGADVYEYQKMTGDLEDLQKRSTNDLPRNRTTKCR